MGLAIENAQGRVEIPPEVEEQGAEAIDAYVAAQQAAKPATHAKRPAATPEKE